MRTCIVIIFISILLNNSISLFVRKYHLPLFLDTCFSIFCGITFGSVHGFLTGVFSNLFELYLYGFTDMLAMDSIINGLVGLGAGLYCKYKCSGNIIFPAVLIVYTTLISMTISLIYAWIFNGHFHHPFMDTCISIFLVLGFGKYISTLGALFLLHLNDKFISVTIAYILWVLYSKHFSDSNDS